MKTKILKPALVAVAVVISGSSCVVRERPHRAVYVGAPAPVASAEVVVSSAPPAPIIETVTIAPAPNYVWIGGHWGWHDRWVWEGGRWGRPPHSGAVWESDRYVYRGGHHVYIRGNWR